MLSVPVGALCGVSIVFVRAELCFVVMNICVRVCFPFRVMVYYMNVTVVGYAMLCDGATYEDVILVNEC